MPISFSCTHTHTLGLNTLGFRIEFSLSPSHLAQTREPSVCEYILSVTSRFLLPILASSSHQPQNQKGMCWHAGLGDSSTFSATSQQAVFTMWLASLFFISSFGPWSPILEPLEKPIYHTIKTSLKVTSKIGMRTIKLFSIL